MQDATRTNRCVARVCDLTSPRLLFKLWPVVLRMARLVHAFRTNPLSPEAASRFETQLADLGRELGRRVVEWTFNNLEPARLPAVYWEGCHYSPKRPSPTRNLNCLFGKIRLWRRLYEDSEGLGLPSLFPLELYLGIVKGVATAALADRVAQLAVELSQRPLLAVLEAEHRVCWGPETLRKVTAAMAEGMSPLVHAARVERVLQWLAEAAAKSGPRRIMLAVGRDGVMLPLRGPAKYREGAAATLSVFSRWGKRLGTVYLGQMPQAGQEALSEELTRLIRDVLAAWQGPTLRLVYITDAGFHPSEYFAKVLSCIPNPCQPGHYYPWEWVVDYYHACQYITKLSEAIFGPGRAAYAWAAKMRRWLKDKPGGVFRVLRSAGALRALRGLHGAESDYDAACGYLRRHAASMDYYTCRRLRKPIGSGVTEAACKVLFTQRFKRAGMQWDIESGGAVLALRVIALSGLWSSVRRRLLAAQEKALPQTHAQYCETMAKIAA